MKKKVNLLIPFIVAIVGAAMLIVTLFMPFASATEEHEKYLQDSDKMYMEEIDMTNEDAVNISLLEYIRIYATTAELGISGDTVIARVVIIDSAIVCVVIIALFIVFAVLTVLFSSLKRPIPIIVFDILSFGVFYLIKWDFEDRGALPNRNYDWGIASVFCYIGIVIAFAGAVWLLVMQIKSKKEIKTVEE